MAETCEPSFTKICSDILGAEGPVFDKDGKFYLVAPEVMKGKAYAGQVLRINLGTGERELVVEPSFDGNGGIPAGCQCDKDNNIWIADMRLGLIKVSPQGQCQQICTTDSKGDIMQGCNDCAMDYAGNLWITAPAGNIAPHPYERSMEEPFGSVYCYTKEKKMVKIDTAIRFPNGIAVLHNQDGVPKQLIVAETPTKILWAYDIKGPGVVGPRSVWGKLPGDLEGGPDGMDFDQEDNLLVAHWGSGHLEVFSSSGGDPHTRIKCPFSRPSNLHFKKGTNTVYVTEHEFHCLWKFEWKRPGKLQYCDTPDQ